MSIGASPSGVRPSECGAPRDETSCTGNVLIVDGDPEIRLAISAYFERHNLPASCASNRSELCWQIAAADPSLIVLDFGLSRKGGFDLLKRVRSKSDIPVIITTSYHLDEIDRIVCLELGADAYLVKPFSTRELLARVRAVLRRQEIGHVLRRRKMERGGYEFGSWRLRCRGRQLVDPAGISVLLSKSEFALLLAFLENPRRPLSRAQLQQAGRIHEGYSNLNIEFLIVRLRRKLEPSMIETQRGVGYMFTLPVEAE